MDDFKDDAIGLNAVNLVYSLKELIMKCKNIESDLLCMCSHWSTMRQDIIAEFYSICERRNSRMSKCQGATLVGGLTVISASLVLTQSFYAFAGTLAIAGAAAVSLSKGYHSSKIQNDSRVLLKARDCLFHDHRETDEILKKIEEEINIVNDINESLINMHPAKLERWDLSRPLLSYEEIIWRIDLFISGDREFYDDLVKQCIIIFRKKLGYMHELKKALGVKTYEPQELVEIENRMIATPNPWYGTLKAVLSSILLISQASRNQDDSSIHYAIERDNYSDNLKHAEAISSSSDGRDDLNTWLVENAQYLQDTTESILCLLEQMKF